MTGVPIVLVALEKTAQIDESKMDFVIREVPAAYTRKHPYIRFVFDLVDPPKRLAYIIDQLRSRIERARKLVRENEEKISLCFYCSFGEAALTPSTWHPLRIPNLFMMVAVDTQGVPLRFFAAAQAGGIPFPALTEALSAMEEKAREMRKNFPKGKKPEGIDLDDATELLFEAFTLVLSDSQT